MELYETAIFVGKKQSNFKYQQVHMGHPKRISTDVMIYPWSRN